MSESEELRLRIGELQVSLRQAQEYNSALRRRIGDLLAASTAVRKAAQDVQDAFLGTFKVSRND